MKRKSKILNRSLAIAIAAAMTITSAPANLVFAAEDIAVEDLFGAGEDFTADAVEEPAVEEPAPTDEELLIEEPADVLVVEPEDVLEEEPAEEPVEEPAAEEEIEIGEFSDDAEFDAGASQEVGTPGTPAQVTGLYIDTNGEYTDAPLLRWNYIPGVYKYEFSVKDAQGREYFNWYQDGNYAYVRDGSTMPCEYIEELAWLYTYDAQGNAVTDAFGDYVKPLLAGQTYTIAVRAVNRYNNGTKETDTPGPWSAPVSYTVGNYTKITKLAYVSQDSDNVYFTYENLAAGGVSFEVATDRAFENTIWVYNYDSNSKLSFSKSRFTPGTTYYVRVINNIYGKEGPVDPITGQKIYSNVASFTVAKTKTPKNITGFKLYKTNYMNSSYEFRFDPVLDEEAGDSFEIQYSKDPNFSEEKTATAYSNRIYMSDLEAGVTYYVRARAYVYDETKGDYVYGTPSKVLTIVKRKVSSISGLKLAEKTQSSYVLSYTGTIMDDEEIQYQISESSAFVSNPEKTKTYVVSGNNDSCFNISYSNLTPGKKYYVRARVHNTNDENEDINKAEREYYGPFTNVVSFSTAIPKINVFSSVVTSTSITLNMDTVNNDKFLTGYQIQRKSGKKYVTIAKTTDNSYKDSKLTKDTAYTYKIRPYYVNPKTNKTTWGSWVYYNTTTWGGNLNLKASPASTTSVKLTWNKISGAKGYEVYRAVTNSGSDKYSSSTGYNSYTKWTLVKTINKSTTKTTTVKGLVSGMSYSFKVRAFKTVGSKKYYIEGVAAADLGFGEAVRILSTKQSTNGKVKVTWAPVRSGNGYLIEKLDDVTGKWKTYKKFTKASTSSYTFPKATGKPVNYRIRAFKKGSVVEYSSATSITVDPFLAAPTGVSVKANNTDGSIKVSWKAVSGADYYVVYRTTSSSSVYDSDTKSYRYTTYSDTVPVYVADATQKSGYKYQYEPLTATSIVDRPVSYTTNGVEQVQYEGPTPGVKYYYYVKAFKYGTAYNYNDRYETTYPSGGSKAAGTTVSLVTVKKPTLKSVKSTAKGKVTVQWSKVSDAKGYVVYRSTKKSSGYTQIATISSAKTVKYTDKTAKSGKKYYYKVRAVKANEAGIDKFSSYSNIKYVSKVK